MAISTLRRLDELLQECNSFGLTVIPTKRKKISEGNYEMTPSKDDAVRALRDYYIADRKAKGTFHKSLDYMLAIDSPMLCEQFKKCKEDVQKEIWDEDNKNWIFEEKIDGCRMVICYDPKTGFDFYSRNNSLTDYLPVNYVENILLPSLDLTKLTHSFVIDSEVIPNTNDISQEVRELGIIAETQLQLVASILALNPEQSRKVQEHISLKFKTFDCLWIDDVSVQDKPYLERRKLLTVIVKELQQAGFNCEFPINYIQQKKTKKQFYNDILQAGGEGCVAKDIHASYDSTGNRHDRWVKLKRTISQSALMENLGDTVDAFVIGFKEADKDKAWSNLIGALSFGTYLLNDDGSKKLDENGEPIIHEIANVSGIPMELREKMTITNSITGKAELNPAYLGKVASLDGQDISAKSFRFSHAILVEWRSDRSADTCGIKESFLKSMVL